MKICPQCESGYSDSLISCPTHGGMLSEIRDLRPGMLIRDTYRIVRKLGKGGMGAVYLAQQTLLDEPRALKFLSEDVSEDESFTSRFLREVRTLRQIRNRHVVDCGDPERAEDGTLFFSMEYVDGPNLRDYLKNSPKLLDVDTALDITRGIAEGLGAAHAKGMVHRDIKPENILMARDGSEWVPKIADFGIVATKENAQQTRTGSMLLTMAYAAPEQWIGTRAADLDGRADIYALGGVLYEMLTGQKAFDAESYHGWAQKHLNAAPPVPSRLRPELAKWRGLDNLVVRMLAKEKTERPQNVAELLTLISAVVYDPAAVWSPPITSEPFDPTAPTVFLPTVKPTPAPPTPATPAAAVPAQQPIQPEPVPSQSAPVPVPNLPTPSVPRPSTAIDTGSAAPPIIKKTASVSEIRARTTGGTKAPAQPKKGKPSVIVWIVLLAVLAGGGYFAQRFFAGKATYSTLQGHNDAVVSVAFSPNGHTLVSAGRDSFVQLWDLSTDKSLIALPERSNAVVYSPDGRSFASAGADNKVTLWDVASAHILATFAGHTDQVLSVAFSPDGRVLASGSADSTIRLWDITGDKTLFILKGHNGSVNSLAYSPDGRTIASGSADSTIDLWDAATGKLLRTLQGHSGPVNSVAFSPDGRTLASGSDDKTIKLWDPASGALTRTLTGHTGAVLSVAFSHDGRMLGSGSTDSTLKLWDLNGNSTTAATTLQGQTGAIESVAFDQAGISVASASEDKTIRLWNLSDVHN